MMCECRGYSSRQEARSFSKLSNVAALDVWLAQIQVGLEYSAGLLHQLTLRKGDFE